MIRVRAMLIAAAVLIAAVPAALARDAQVRGRLADVGAYVDESLHEIHTVQAYGHEAVDKQLFANRIEQVMQAAAQRIFYRSLLIAAVMLLSISAMVLISWVGAQDVMAGSVSAGELTAFMFYAVMVAGSAATISEVIGDIQRAAGATERLIELATAQVDISSPAQPLNLNKPVSGAISIRQLCFAYPQVADKSVLQQLNIDIQPGERIALVGASGAGKTTLFQLLQLFYQPTSGQILLDGTDISALDIATLRAQFALVPQESVIFATTVLENVRYGRPDATEQDVINACCFSNLSGSNHDLNKLGRTL